MYMVYLLSLPSHVAVNTPSIYLTLAPNNIICQFTHLIHCCCLVHPRFSLCNPSASANIIYSLVSIPYLSLILLYCKVSNNNNNNNNNHLSTSFTFKTLCKNNTIDELWLLNIFSLDLSYCMHTQCSRVVHMAIFITVKILSSFPKGPLIFLIKFR